MAKVSKHRRLKRTTLLIKRTVSRCIKNTKKPIKTPTPKYQKLKVNNHSLAKALAQERQDTHMLFSRNNELLAEIQDLIHDCNKRDLVISNILKNSKEIMQMLVTMSGFLSNIISSCQEFFSNQIPHRASSSSSSSAGRRESSTSRRLSAKSPARGVVKPMVSGHTITKPTINLSRVNMPRPPISNLSIIEESSTPERNPERSGLENRRSRGSSERLQIPTHRIEDDEDRLILRRKSNRYSGGRLSLGRYSKRNSGRLSGGSIVGRLSKRGSDSFELPKSPRVTLQDVSRYLTNNQTVNVRLLSETTNGKHNTSSSNSSPEESPTSEPSSLEENTRANDEGNRGMVNLISQNDSESQNTSESEPEGTLVQQTRKSTLKSSTSSKSKEKRSVRFQNRLTTSYNSDDPLEGPSWLYSNDLEEENVEENSGRENQNNSSNEMNHNSSTGMEQSSPVSSLSPERRRSSGNFRVPELPKRFAKPPAASRLNLNDEFDSPNYKFANGETSSGFVNQNGDVNSNEEENDDDDRPVNLCFITQRRGRTNNDDDDDDDDDDETIMLNMQRQLRQPQSRQHQSPEQSERMQFDINELLQLTPLKPLMNINCSSNGLIQPESEAEPTVTVQLTQKIHPRPDESITTTRMSTVKLHQLNARNLDAAVSTSNGQKPRRFSELSTSRLSSRIELPRLTELHTSFTDDNLHQQSNMIFTPDISKNLPEKRKRIVEKQYSELRHSESEEEEELPKQKTKKPKQRKKKKQSENKDPSSVKVVLQKLNDTKQMLSKSEHKNYNESISSTRSPTMSRIDQSSDSECSINSNNSKPTSTRPRRQKAPKNLTEPNMKKKLRR